MFERYATTISTASMSTAVEVPGWAKKIGIWVPDLNGTDNAAVSLHVSFDDTTYVPLLDEDGDDYVVCATTKDPCFVDVTPKLHGNFYTYGNTNKMYLKLGISVATNATATTSYFYFGD